MKVAMWFFFVFSFVIFFTYPVAAQTTEFTYQGSLINSGIPATGNFDFEFALYDALTNGTQAGTTLTRSSVAVTGGTFAVSLDFGASGFPGASRYLEIRVRPAGAGGFTTLAPRSQLKSAPYAIRALTVTGPVNGTDPVATLTVTNAQPGVVDDGQPISPPAALRAVATSTTNTNVGLIGSSDGSTGIGVAGLVTGASTTPGTRAIGIIGLATSTTGRTRAIQAQIWSPDGTAVFAKSTTGVLFEGEAGEITRFTVDASGNVSGSGTAHFQNLIVSGTKNAVATLPDGRRVLLYATESPENWFEDFGTVTLKNGRAVVKIDKTFALTTNTAVPYQIFLTPNGNCRGLYVTRKTADSFEVRELGGGRSNVKVDFRIVARRRGYENVRFAPAPLPPNTKR